MLVAHGGLIAGLVCGLLALPTSAWPPIGGIGNCRWAALARRADHPRWRLAGYNVGPAPDGPCPRPAGRVLLVLADSLAFHGPERAEPADEPRLWPNVAAAALGGRAELVAGIGWTARHAWHALIPRPAGVGAAAAVDALVLGVGGMDTLPSPLPTALRELIPALRPDGLRRAVRAGYLRRQPALARAFARGAARRRAGRAAAAADRRLPGAVPAAPCSTIRPELPVVAVLPPVHRAAVYGPVHAGRRRGRARHPRVGARARGRAAGPARRSSASTCSAATATPTACTGAGTAHAAVGAACADLLRPRSPADQPR